MDNEEYLDTRCRSIHNAKIYLKTDQRNPGTAMALHLYAANSDRTSSAMETSNYTKSQSNDVTVYLCNHTQKNNKS